MRPPRLLWAAPYCLHDTSSGAAIHVRAMLEKVAERGVAVRVLSALTFDAPVGTSLFPNLEEQLASGHVFFDVEANGVACQYMKTASLDVMAMTNAEERVFYTRFLDTLRVFPPDAIMHFGGSLLDLGIRAEAARRGIPVIFALMNGSYAGYDFPQCELVLTIGPAAARAYGGASRVNVVYTGPFIRPERVLADAQEEEGKLPDEKRILFVNPHPAKGVSLVARLALMAREARPELRFLVVQSRGDWFAAIKSLGLAPEDFPNVDVARHVSDMRPVYAGSRLLLAPSFWYEAFGLVAAEALQNGIPVLASSGNGLADAVGEGGLLLEVPAECLADMARLPSEEAVRPWFEAMLRLIDPAEAGQWRTKASAAGRAHDIERSTDRALSALEPLFARRSGDRPGLFL